MKKPEIAATARVFPNAVVVGDVKLGEDCSVWYGAVVRGDDAPIEIGAGTNVQECAVIHVDEGFPVHIGKNVTVGHGAIVHGCTVGDGALIGMGATLLNGAVIGENCMVAAGALVTGGTEAPPGTLLMGAPAKVRRALTAEEIEANHRNARHYVARKEEDR